jgi:hypothetical protein
MYPHPLIMLELARQRREALFGTADARRAPGLAWRHDVDTGRSLRLHTLLCRWARLIAPASARFDRRCGHASHS